MKILRNQLEKKSRLLGVDPGKNRVGLAISDEDKLVSTPLKTIIKKNNSNFINEFQGIIIENDIKGIIIGNPINMDGSSGPSANQPRILLGIYQIMFQYLSACGTKDCQVRVLLIYRVI